MNGYITIDKKILEWEWYRSKNESRLFIHLLLMACFKDVKLRKIHVKRGQLVTTIHKLSAETGLSIQAVRTALKNLQSTNEITYKSTNEFSIVTICNYNSYQDKNSTTNKPTNTQTNKPINKRTNKRTNNRINNTIKESVVVDNPLGGLPTNINVVQFIEAVQYHSSSPDTDKAIAKKIKEKFEQSNWNYKGKPIDKNNIDTAVCNALKEIAL